MLTFTHIAHQKTPTSYFAMTEPILIAKSGDKKPVELFLLPGMANRHGLIAGATGTGMTVSLQTLAENLSRIGVPIFMSDVTGDLSGIAARAMASEAGRRIIRGMLGSILGGKR
jgi:hypothetical protein